MVPHPQARAETNAIEDLTSDNTGDICLWIGQQKVYFDVPNYVSNELCRRTSAIPSVLALLPSTLPVMQLLELTTPQVVESFQNIKPDDLFSFHEATHSSSEWLQLQVLAPSKDFLKQLRSCAGQAMIDGKISIQHWERKDVFLSFDILGTWARIQEVDAAKKAWTAALRWLTGRPQNIPEQYVIRIMMILRNVPWKEYINGLGSALTTTDMASFLSREIREWLSDLHIYTMLAVTRCLRQDALSEAIPCTEIASPDFAAHILTSRARFDDPLQAALWNSKQGSFSKYSTHSC
jgi:hypothetical protein